MGSADADGYGAARNGRARSMTRNWFDCAPTKPTRPPPASLIWLAIRSSGCGCWSRRGQNLDVDVVAQRAILGGVVSNSMGAGQRVDGSAERIH